MSNYLRTKYVLSEYSRFGAKQYVASQIELDKKFEKHLETLDREKRKEISKDLKAKTIEAGIRYAYSDFEGIGTDHLEMDKKIKLLEIEGVDTTKYHLPKRWYDEKIVCLGIVALLIVFLVTLKIQDTLYQKAVYGGLKVDDKGQSLLVGLYDEDFHLIQSDK